MGCGGSGAFYLSSELIYVTESKSPPPLYILLMGVGYTILKDTFAIMLNTNQTCKHDKCKHERDCNDLQISENNILLKT